MTTVAASPFNGIKVDIVLILTGAGLLWLLQGRMPASEGLRLGILLCYGVIGGTWVIYRVRRILRRQQASPGDEKHHGAQ